MKEREGERGRERESERVGDRIGSDVPCGQHALEFPAPPVEILPKLAADATNEAFLWESLVCQ